MKVYLGYFLLSTIISYISTLVLIFVMKRFGVVDHPKKLERKKHKKVTPLGGGFAIFLSFFICTFLLFQFGQISWLVSSRNIWGIFLGGFILMIGGFLDDKYSVKARYQFLYTFFAVAVVFFAGLGPHIIGNPFGGALSLDSLTFSFPGIGEIIFFADLLVFFWVFLLMSTTKFLDGLDGLAAGTVFIGALVLFFLSLQGQWFQPEISYLSIVFSGALFGFLLLNFHPAKIFLGEGGSLFIGFLLACLATLAGGKIAVTFLLLGVPFLDIVRVMLKRIQKGQPIFVGDREHLHLLLVDSGLGHRQTVLFFYGISLLFGFSILFFQSSDHIFAFILILLLILFISVWFSKK